MIRKEGYFMYDINRPETLVYEQEDKVFLAHVYHSGRTGSYHAIVEDASSNVDGHFFGSGSTRDKAAHEAIRSILNEREKL
ncbi:hypothetical protein [Bacillus sp. FJAT-44742]|uniref:hypothetical protein n=1 Tax=Bacillus sp. FJAT-44742 TaxID=2014005 RepID=UPI001E4DCF3D|nr:hypothetical protein [Bacillus sp. FJAT-44742]